MGDDYAMDLESMSKHVNGRIRHQIVDIYKSFVDEVDPEDILDHLIQKRVITIDRKDELMTRKTRQGRCRALLDQLLTCSHDKAFVFLRESLLENYPWIVERIDRGKDDDTIEDNHNAAANNVRDMVRRLEELERQTELQGRKLSENECKLLEKKDLLKRELDRTRKDLELSRENEALLESRLKDAARLIAESESREEECRLQNAALESQVCRLQSSLEEAAKRENQLRQQISCLENRLESTTNGGNLVGGEWTELTAEKDKPELASQISCTATPPPLPPRRSSSYSQLLVSETEHLATSCFQLKDVEIKYSDLSLQYIIDTYQRSEVYRGKWKESSDVYVRKLICHRQTPEEFFHEAVILHRLNHENVVKLIGISSLAKPFYIVTEYLPVGNVKDYLKREKSASLEFLVDASKQVADAMSYVSQQGLVHRDLRAGNIIMDNNNIVKVSNFELALDLKEERTPPTHNEPRFPLKWTAPEAIVSSRWSPASDVWSFGVLLYELFTLGEVPYAGKTGNEVYNLIQSSFRLPCPKGENFTCPDAVHLTMLWCWGKDPDDRPTFEMLRSFFQEFSQEPENTKDELALLTRPFLLGVIKGDTAVRGMAMLDNQLYVVRFGSTLVEIYDANDDFKRSRKSIFIAPPGEKIKVGFLKRLKSARKSVNTSSGIQDITNCNLTKRLYLSDWQNRCVHCVDPVRREVVHSWGVEHGEPWGISVDAEGFVVVSCEGHLCVYSNKGVLIRKMVLEMVEEGPWHGLQIAGECWVVCHGGRYTNGYVCAINPDGSCQKDYNEVSLGGPSHLALLPNGRILVVESHRNRVVLLGKSFRGPVREILNPDHGLVMPVRLHYCSDSGRLVVGLVDGTVLVYQIMTSGPFGTPPG